MSAEVDSVALVVVGWAIPPRAPPLLKHNRLDICAFEKFVSGSQPGGAAPGKLRRFVHSLDRSMFSCAVSCELTAPLRIALPGALPAVFYLKRLRRSSTIHIRPSPAGHRLAHTVLITQVNTPKSTQQYPPARSRSS